MFQVRIGNLVEELLEFGARATRSKLEQFPALNRVEIVCALFQQWHDARRSEQRTTDSLRIDVRDPPNDCARAARPISGSLDELDRCIKFRGESQGLDDRGRIDGLRPL